ncbi:MAG: Esterase EstB [Firmicutes bacterium]|nr:Esterase EstB [candidate division NPL-UPA2 bacterium]
MDVALVSLLTGEGHAAARASLQAVNGSIGRAITMRGSPKPPANTTSVHKTHGKGKVDPIALGFSPKRLEAAFDVVCRAVGDGGGTIPGAVAAIVRRGQIIGPRAYGLAVRSLERVAMRPHTIFDVASLTKVMATLPAVLLLIERGLARLDDPLALFVPSFGRAGKDKVTLRHLLTHTSRLPAHVDLWHLGLSRLEIIEHICNLQLEDQARLGTDVIYSDLGFIMLGEFVHAVTGQSIADFARENIFEPLGMIDTDFLPPDDKRHRIAATEYRGDYGKYMWGEVHDENAYAMGGVAGHAGLFSTAEDVARYAAMWLNGGTHQGKAVLSRLTVRTATARHTGGAEPRGLGWILPSGTHSSGGDLLSPRAFGHTGFTGTSLWCIPESDIGIVLLTNRVHAGRNGTDIYPLRARFANAVLAHAE